VDAASPAFARLRRLEQELTGTGKAIAGLTAARKRATPEKATVLQQKLEAFQARQQALREEQAELIRSSPPRQDRLRLDAEWQRLRSAVGLDREEARLAQLLKQQGRRSGRSGEAFERLAPTLTRTHILPDLLRDSETSEDLLVLRGVTLGAARVEFDQLVVRRPGGGSQPVEVLAVVEVKRNLNDVAHGFRRRQEDLAWLTGDTDRYDPGSHRTRTFPSGHFDRVAVHRDGGEAFVFARSSFRRFRREPGGGWFLRRLYFLTRPGTMWGVSSAALARIGFRVATDERWEPDSDAYLGKLRRWCQSLAEPIETPDVLRLYTAARGRGHQVLLVGR
jgi:hypothetical protein